MKFDKYKIASTIVSGLILVLVGCSLYLTVATIISEKGLKFQPDIPGFEYFLKLFDLPIKLTVAAFAASAAWLTLERISQTERQLDIISDHNKFNNYYKHIDEFIKFISEDTLIKLWEKVIDYDKRAFLTLLYKDYYYENYKKFDPHLNDDRIQLIESFYTTLFASRLVVPHTDIETLSIQGLQPLAALVDGYCQTLIDPVTESRINDVQRYLGTLNLTPVQIQTELERYRIINRIYWGSSFYMNVMAFDGKLQDRTQDFATNYENYLFYLGLN